MELIDFSARIDNAPGADALSKSRRKIMSLTPINKTGASARVGSVHFIDGKMEFFVCYMNCTKCEQRFRVTMTKSEAENFAQSMGLYDPKTKRKVKQIIFLKLRDFFAAQASRA